MLASRILNSLRCSTVSCSSSKASNPSASIVGHVKGANYVLNRKVGSLGVQLQSSRRWCTTRSFLEDRQTVPWARSSVSDAEEAVTRVVSKTEKDQALLASIKRGDMKQLKVLVDESTPLDWSNVRTVELILRAHALLGLDASVVLKYCLSRIDVWSEQDFERLAPVLLNECRLWRNSEVKKFSGSASAAQQIYQSAKSRSGAHMSSAFYVAYARALLLSARSVEEQKQFAFELIRILEDHEPHTLDMSPFASTLLQNLVNYHSIGPEGWYWSGGGSKLELRTPTHHESLIVRIWDILQTKGIHMDLSLAHSCLKAFAAGHMDLNFAEHVHQALLAQHIALPPYCISLIIAGLYTRGLHDDALQWIDVLNQSSQTLPLQAQALSLTAAFTIHAKRGDLEKAKSLLDQATAIPETKPLQWLLPVLQAHSEPLTLHFCESATLIPYEGRKHLALLQLIPPLVKLSKLDLAIAVTESIAINNIQRTDDLHGLQECLEMVMQVPWDEQQSSTHTLAILRRIQESVNALPTATDTKLHRNLLKKAVLSLLEALHEMENLPPVSDSNAVRTASVGANRHEESQ